MELLYAALVGYGFGSLPIAYWFGILQGKNLLAEGTGNIGARNAWRVLGAMPGLMVLVLDIIKGLMAVAMGEFIAKDINGGLLAGALAVVGHCYSVWLLGKGGKGIAPAVGVLFAIKPALLVAVLLLLAIAYGLSRNLYRAVLITAALLPISAVFIGGSLAYLWFGFGVGIPIMLRHLPDWNRSSDAVGTPAQTKSKD